MAAANAATIVPRDPQQTTLDSQNITSGLRPKPYRGRQSSNNRPKHTQAQGTRRGRVHRTEQRQWRKDIYTMNLTLRRANLTAVSLRPYWSPILGISTVIVPRISEYGPTQLSIPCSRAVRYWGKSRYHIL